MAENFFFTITAKTRKFGGILAIAHLWNKQNNRMYPVEQFAKKMKNKN